MSAAYVRTDAPKPAGLNDTRVHPMPDGKTVRARLARVNTPFEGRTHGNVPGRE
jgi:hypothetical protein